MKGQSSIEFLIVVAFSLVALAGIVFFANSRIEGVNSTLNEQLAQSSVDSLASAAKSVFVQGNGAVKSLVLRIPEKINSGKSGILNDSIVYNVSGRSFFKSLDFPIEGSLPLEAGYKVVRVSSSNGIVSFAPSSVFLSKFSFFVFLRQGSSFQDSLVLKNYSRNNVLVSLKKALNSGDVSLSFSTLEFDLNSGSSESVELLFSSKPTASGNYFGGITASITDVNVFETVEVPLIFEVSGTGILSVFPSSISGNFLAGSSHSQTLSVCNNSQGMLSGIIFQASADSPGEWFSQVENIEELAPGCVDRSVEFYIPSMASGQYSGFLTFSDGFNVASVDLNFNVEAG